MAQFPALLADLPATFEHAADSEPGLSLSHPTGMTWTVSDRDVLTVGHGQQTRDYDLRTHTLATLAARLATDLDIQTTDPRPDAATVPARRLCPGTGAAPDERMTRLPVYGSALWGLLKTLATALDEAEDGEDAALRQLLLPSARGHWTDFWGRYFGVARIGGEADAEYAQRIIDEVFRARNNPRAMENNVARLTGYSVTLYEPWRNMWTLDRSRLDGSDYLPGEYHRYHILHPIAPGAVDWPTAIRVIGEDRPAGTVLWRESYRLAPRVVSLDYDGWSVIITRSRLRQNRYGIMQNNRLDVDLLLSGRNPTPQPKSVAGHFYQSTVASCTPTWTMGAVQTHDLIQRVTIFDGATPGWSGAWDAKTWSERAAGIAIAVESRTSQEQA